MSIDIRARVYCSLGPIIEGSFADDHLQGSGLVKCRGQVRLSGIYRPDIGQVVEFAWKRGNIAARLPRKLRVLSSFADPYRRETTVQIGCKLTMFDDVTPNIGIKPGSSVVDSMGLYIEARIKGRRAATGGSFVASAEIPNEAVELQKLIQEYQYVQRFVAVPMNAKALVEYLCKYMKIELAQTVPLTSNFAQIDQIDLTGGILPVLSDLLVSESYFGYLDERERLVIRSLDTDAGTGPVLGSASIIDLSPIGVGNRPGEAVVVSYATTRRITRTADVEVDYDAANPITDEQIPGDSAPAPPAPPADPVDPLEDVSGWRQDRTIGFPVTVPLSYTLPNGDEQTDEYSYTPVTVSVTEYQGGKMIRTTQTSTQPLWAAAQGYAAQRLAGQLGLPSGTVETRSVTNYTYDSLGRQSRVVTEEYESEAQVAGGLSLQFVFEDAEGGGNVELSTAEVQTGLTIVEKEYAGNFEKTVTARYVHWAKTQSGQQGSTEARLALETAAGVQAYVAQIGGRSLVDQGLEIQTTLTSPENQVNADVPGQDPTDPSSTVGTSSPKPVDLERRAYGKAATGDRYSRNRANVEVVQETANLLYSYGTVDADRVIRLTLPYPGDPVFEPGTVAISSGTGTTTQGMYYMPTNWTPKLSNVQEQALQFGRVQNRLLIGNRQGVGIQIPAELMPVARFDPVYIKADSLTGQYRVNAASWTFSRDGIVASVDALFWGGVGS